MIVRYRLLQVLQSQIKETSAKRSCIMSSSNERKRQNTTHSLFRCLAFALAAEHRHKFQRKIATTGRIPTSPPLYPIPTALQHTTRILDVVMSSVSAKEKSITNTYVFNSPFLPQFRRQSIDLCISAKIKTPVVAARRSGVVLMMRDIYANPYIPVITGRGWIGGRKRDRK